MPNGEFANPQQGSGQEPPKAVPLTICVGDLHGNYERALKLWENLERKVGSEVFSKSTIIFLGDYNDRGPRTKDVLDWLVSLAAKYPHQKQVFLAGNHDFSFAAFAGCLPAVPEGFDYKSTWARFASEEEREGWYTGPGHETMHVQGRRWAGLIKDKISPKGHAYDMSTFDSGATFRSYGVEFADLEGLRKAMPQSHKDFLRDLTWVYEQEGVETGDPATSYSKLIAVHAGFEAGVPLEQQMERLKARVPTMERLEEMSGRKNVYKNLPELESEKVLVVSGHHGVLDTTDPLRLIIDEGGGRDKPIAAIILPWRELVRDTDVFPEGLAEKAAAMSVAEAEAAPVLA